ncbi:hypothetical protein B0H17DRAFT_1146206 [Mycena rosella]|uniref:Uncharacterized protein n=1 Tax=Mycena rosella TaxID=1033263 RepID=A0AAD7CPD9_MYCRO|nr:hypothetical protein B0H17DRAFT_1146206 [Mycena rosella]
MSRSEIQSDNLFLEGILYKGRQLSLGTTLSEAPHTDISEYPYGATDLSLPEDVDARARDSIRSPEPSSPLPNVLVRMVVQATEKIADKFHPTDTAGAQAATDIAEGFRAKSSDATALPIDPDYGPLADSSAASNGVVEAVCYEFRNLATEYLTQDNVEGLVELAVHKRAQKGKGRAEPAVPFPQAGRPVFLSPIAHKMEEGEVDEDMPLVDPQLHNFFDPGSIRSDPHLDADTERAIAENLLVNSALPEFDPAHLAHAKTNSLGLDPGPASQDASSSHLTDDPPAAACHPDGPSGVSPSPPKKARHNDLEPIDTTPARVTCASAAAASAQSTAPQNAAGSNPQPLPIDTASARVTCTSATAAVCAARTQNTTGSGAQPLSYAAAVTTPFTPPTTLALPNTALTCTTQLAAVHSPRPTPPLSLRPSRPLPH